MGFNPTVSTKPEAIFDDHDDLSLSNVERERSDARIEARRDADEFSRLILGDTRTDEQLRLAFINGERTEATRAGFNRCKDRELESIAKNSRAPLTVEEEEAEEEAERLRSNSAIRARMAGAQ